MKKRPDIVRGQETHDTKALRQSYSWSEEKIVSVVGTRSEENILFDDYDSFIIKKFSPCHVML
jgi:hypothetical protein